AATIAAIAGWYLFRRPQWTSQQSLQLTALLVAVACIVATGLGIKPRNAVFLLPLVILIQSAALTQLPIWSRVAAATLLMVYQALGVWNVVAHVNTAKGSYNTDYKSAMADIRRWRRDCGGIVVVNHDPVLSYLLESERIPQSSPY